MNNSSRQNEVSMASLYYRCEKYSEIIKIAKKLIQDNPVLSESEMAVFIEGYKYKLNELRKSLVKLLDLEQKEIKRGSSHAHLIRELIDPKISELSNLCDDFNAQIDILITKAKNFDSMANLSRLKLDFLRYKCQFIEKGEEWQKTYDEFFGTINKIETIGKEFLGKNNINSLYIQLCKCVFYYEVLNKPKEAVEMGKTLLKNVLCPPEKQPPPLVAKIEKVEEKKEEEIKPSVIDDEKKNEKKDDKKKTRKKKKNNNKNKDEKKEKNKRKEKEQKNTERKKETFPAEKTLSDKKTENNFSSKEETRDFNITFEKAILTPELKQFIYILRTDIILWSGKHESDVKL